MTAPDLAFAKPSAQRPTFLAVLTVAAGVSLTVSAAGAFASTGAGFASCLALNTSARGSGEAVSSLRAVCFSFGLNASALGLAVSFAASGFSSALRTGNLFRRGEASSLPVRFS